MDAKPVLDLSDAAFKTLVEKTLDHDIFKKSNKKEVERIVKNSTLKTAKSSTYIWEHARDKEEMPFSLILEGCIAVVVAIPVIPGTRINNLLFTKQFFGEFGLWKEFKPRSHYLQCLSDVEILVPDQEDIRNLTGDTRSNFYEGLAKILAGKLKDQNYTTSLRSRKNVDERLAYLLRRFEHSDFWTQFIDKKGETYTINIYWSTPVFQGILNSEHKTICQSLAKMVGDKHIQVDQHNTDFSFDKTLTEGYLNEIALKRKNQIIDNDYVKIKVLDPENMSRKHNITD